MHTESGTNSQRKRRTVHTSPNAVAVPEMSGRKRGKSIPEDISRPETDPAWRSLSSSGEAARHKADLEALKTRDPEFFNYLLQTDRELLDFGTDAEPEGSLEAQSEQRRQGVAGAQVR